MPPQNTKVGQKKLVEYLLFGDVELASNDLGHSQSTIWARQHGCEAVKSLTEKTPRKKQQSIKIRHTLSQLTYTFIHRLFTFRFGSGHEQYLTEYH